MDKKVRVAITHGDTNDDAGYVYTYYIWFAQDSYIPSQVDGYRNPVYNH